MNSEETQEKNTEINLFSRFNLNVIENDNKKNINKDKETQNDILSVLRTERADWTDIIRDFSKRFKDIDDLVSLQIDLFSNRQLITERKAYISEIILKQNKKLKKNKAIEYQDLKINSNLNLTKSVESIKIFLDDRLCEYDESVETFQIHLNFLNDSIDTLDRMIFGIKHRIQIQEMMA